MTFNYKLRKFVHIFHSSYKVVFINSFRLYSCKPSVGPPWNVLFFGTDSFSLDSLKSLWAKLNTGTLISDLAVVSKKGSIVRNFAESEGLTVFDWPLEVNKIDSKFHVGMVVSFGHLISEDIIKSFPLGCVNVHASLLPRWRGAAPVIHAISNGDTETGITIMRIRPHRFDTGEIVKQYRIPIDPNETSIELQNKLGFYGSNLLMECLRDMPRCLDKAIAQPDIGVTLAPKVNSTMASIYWNKMSALQVYNLHRALQHIYPLTTRWHNCSAKLHHISLEKKFVDFKQATTSSKSSEEKSKRSALDFLSSPSTELKPIKPIRPIPIDNCGQIKYDKKAKQLRVLCSDGNYIIVKKLTLGGKTMTAADFHNGFLTKKSYDNWFFS